MAENLMSSDHKATNEEYRKNYDRIFRKERDEKTELDVRKVRVS